MGGCTMGIRLTAAGYGRISHVVRPGREVCVGWQFPGLEGVVLRESEEPGGCLDCLGVENGIRGMGSFFDALRRGKERVVCMYVCMYVQMYSETFMPMRGVERNFARRNQVDFQTGSG